MVVRSPGFDHRCPDSVASGGSVGPLPVVEETLRVDKRPVLRGRFRISTHTGVTEHLIREALRTEKVVVSSVRIDRILAEDEPVPVVRTEGSVTIIPVFEEIQVVEKRLVLREEVHIDRSVETHQVEIPITLLRQRAVIESVSMEGVVTSVDSVNKDKCPMKHTITALFDQETMARLAMDDLIEAGILRSDVRIVPGASDTAGHSTVSYDHQRDAGGFWATLKNVFMPDEDRYTYSEGLSRGGTMLSVNTADVDRERVSDLLERSGAVNLDQREEAWRKSGWSGYSGFSTTGSTAGGVAPSIPMHDDRTAVTDDATGSFLGSIAQKIEKAVDGHGTANETDFIPVVEERLDVSKRAVDHGRVRLRSYVVETPVQQQVSLHDEVVHVDRRKVDRPLSASDVDPFAERTIEIDEKGEEVVVNKVARVVEEVGLRKDGVDRTETVNDKVRRTEVEIEDERTGSDARPLTSRT